jgi:flagellar hook-basal body complex protein FliE
MNEELKRITGLPEPIRPTGTPSERPGAPEKPSFAEVIGNLVKDVDQLQKTAAATTEKLVTGELQDVHQVVVAMEEAQTSFRLLMEVRNKMVEAYREVMKMQT